jgi:hypothetical protein
VQPEAPLQVWLPAQVLQPSPQGPLVLPPQGPLVLPLWGLEPVGRWVC